MHRRTKIICTIGPAVSDEKSLEKLILAGMNVARINFSHGSHEEHKKTISILKAFRKSMGVPLAIMLDTKGPEIRVGVLPGDELRLKAGMRVRLVKSDPKEGEIPIGPAHVVDELEVGMTVLFDDGYITSKVVEKGAVVEIENDGILKSRKGVNVPHGAITLPAVTEKDITDIHFGCQEDVDIVAASFVRSPDHILEIKKLLTDAGHPEMVVLAKIENAEGVKNFDSILQVADGVMVARGDLGVELPLNKVPSLQKMMIQHCYHSSKPVVIATQMLESMIHNPRPTRAEVSDVANAIYDSTSAVMLSGETAVGKYPIETVKMMRSIVEEAEKDFDYQAFFAQDSRGSYYDVSSSVALAVVKTAYSSKAKAIFAFSNSGSTARAIARFRPEFPILTMTPNEKNFHQMAINWGVVPMMAHVDNVADGFQELSCYALKKKLALYGDLVVVSCGSPFGISGTTNTMIVENIGDVLVRGLASKGERVYGKVAMILSSDLNNAYRARGRIVVLSTCNDSFLPLLGHATAIVLQNHPDDKASEKSAKAAAKSFNIPLLARADHALTILKEGQLITIDPVKGLIFKGALLSEEEMLSRVCKES